MSTSRYIVAILLVAGLPPGLLWWFVIHPFVGFWRRVGVERTMWSLGILSVVGLVAIVALRHVVLGRDLGTNWILVGLAAVFLVGAGTISVKRKRHLTMRILAGIPEIDGDGGTLLTEGPYAVIRHPRYVEVVFGVMAYACFANYVGAWVVAFATIPAIHAIVILEERELAQRFGDAWYAYRSRVPRYIPSVPGAVNSASTTSHT